MTATPAETPSPSILRKRVAGVPVVYLAGGAVVVLAAFAFTTKRNAPAASSDASTGDTAPQEASTDTILNESAVPPVPLGTVTAPTTASPPTVNDNNAIDTNDEWLKRGVAYGIKRGHKPGDMQAILQMYLDGQELSFWQGGIRDEVIRELGLPPYPPTIGGTRPDYGRVQGPLPRQHIVKNVAENSAGKLAALYYGSSQKAAPIVSANGGASNYAVGQKVNIPVYPKPKAPPAKPAIKPPVKK